MRRTLMVKKSSAALAFTASHKYYPWYVSPLFGNHIFTKKFNQS
jgi:hypothetical protein